MEFSESRNTDFAKPIRIAQIHLKQFSALFKNQFNLIGNVYPVYEPDAKTPVLFEVTLRNAEGQHGGYILVSTSGKYPPVLAFSPTGKGSMESLREKVGYRNYRPIYYTPFFTVAEDEGGKYLAHYGEIPTLPIKKRVSKGGFNYERFKTGFLSLVDEEIAARKQITAQNWEQFRKKGTKGEEFDDYVDPEDIPPLDFQIVSIRFPEFLPRFMQVPASTGANSTRPYATGCTANAWMGLIGYHNNVYTLDLLRGTHYKSGSDDSYIARVMFALAEHLGTHFSEGGEGSVSMEDVKKGYSFITDVLGYNQIADVVGDGNATDLLGYFGTIGAYFTENSGLPALQVVYDALCNNYMPSVVSVPNHAVVAHAALIDQSGNGNHHFVKVYPGREFADKYISYTSMTGAWALEKIFTQHDFYTGHSSLCTPSTIEIGDPDVGTTLLIGTRLANEHIGILYSEDGKTFDLKYEIPATGLNPPSFAVRENGENPYIAWKETDGTLKLVQVNDKVDEIAVLPAPNFVSAPECGGPVIQIFHGKLFYVWDSWMAYTNLQNLESGQAWLDEEGYDGVGDLYLGFFDFLASPEPPCLIFVPGKTEATDRLYFSCRALGPWYQEFDYEMRVFSIKQAGLPDEGMVKVHSTTTGNEVYPGKRKIIYTNRIFVSHDYHGLLLGTNNGPIYEIDGSPAGNFELVQTYSPYWLNSPKTNLGVFSSYKIGPCVFTIYLTSGGKIRIRYHSIDGEWQHALDYEGWPDF